MTPQNSTFCTFRTAGRWFGAPIEDVKEVNRQATTTRIPHAPPEVSGYVNIRGHIYLALDMARLLGLEPSLQAERHLILFTAAIGPSFGIVVDEIGDITSVDANRIDELDQRTSMIHDESWLDRTHLATRICRCDHELLIVLDPRRFLKIVEQGMTA